MWEVTVNYISLQLFLKKEEQPCTQFYFILFLEVFSKLGSARSAYGQDVQRNWSEFNNVPSSIWDPSATDSVPSWPTSSSSPTHTTAVSIQCKYSALLPLPTCSVPAV